MSPDPRASILAFTEEAPLVPLDGFEGAFIRCLTIDEVDKLAGYQQSSGIHLMVMAIVDVKGQRIFEAEDVDRLRKLRSMVFNQISRQVTKVNNLDPTAADDATKN